jgi:hypothetical protein
VEKIDKFFKELTDEGISTKVTKRPPEFVWFSFEFQLKAGIISVAQKRESIIESVGINYSGLALQVQMRDNNPEVLLELSTLKIDMIDNGK